MDILVPWHHDLLALLHWCSLILRNSGYVVKMSICNVWRIMEEETLLWPLISTCTCTGKLIPLLYMDTKIIEIKKWVRLCTFVILALGDRNRRAWSSRSSLATQWIRGQCGLHETQSQKVNKQNTNWTVTLSMICVLQTRKQRHAPFPQHCTTEGQM